VSTPGGLANLSDGWGRPPTAGRGFTCYAPWCQAAVPYPACMCTPCWRSVPLDVKRAVLRVETPWNGEGELPEAHRRAVNAVAVADGRELPYPAEYEAAVGLPAPGEGPRGDLDLVVVRAVRAARPLTAAERADVEARHPHGEPGETCPACRFRFRPGHRSCPSRLFAVSGARAAVAALPATTGRCRACHQPVSVQAGAAGSVVCESCEVQPDLFGGAS
jgi:hypothetical protein